MFRIYWENDTCNKPRKYYCSDHKEVLCNGWFTALHVRCKCDEIPDKEDVIEYLNEEFNMYTERLAKIDKMARYFNIKSLYIYFFKLIDNNKFHKFFSIKGKIFGQIFFI